MLRRTGISEIAIGVLLATAFAGPAIADDATQPDVGDVMMSVIEEPDAGEDQFVDEIQLPPAAADTAKTEARDGLDTANEARSGGRDFGQSRAQEARQQGQAARGVAGGAGRPTEAPGQSGSTPAASKP